MEENQQYQQMIINEQYLTIKKIGQGGFGVVWRAYDFSLRNFVALKELLKDYSEPKFVEMLYREALIAKNIIHDNIVRVQHFWQGSNGSYYLLMDYVQGKDLEHLLSKCNSTNTPLPWELAVLICGSVLKALDYANRLAKDPITNKPYGIVYRDISPGNIIISFDGSVKLSDFGIAKTADELSMGVKQRIVTGKYGYMSPEQTRGDADIDHRSDIFSVGVVLYEMLSGKQAFSGESVSDTLASVLKLEPNWEALPADTPLPIRKLVQRCLIKDRKRRLQAIGEARITIDECLAEPARAVSVPKQAKRGSSTLP
jgi:serine/threonine protein kinase